MQSKLKELVMHRSLAVAVVSLWGMIAVTPAAAISIDFVPAAQTRFLGEAVSVGVVVSGLLGPTPDQVVSGFDLDVLYNPAILTATGVTFSAFLGGPLDSIPVSSLSSGRIDFAEASFLDNAALLALQADQVTIATLHFTAIGLGTSPLTFDPVAAPGIDIAGLDGDPLLDLDVGDGSVTVIPRQNGTPVPTPGGLLLIVGPLAWLAMRRPAHAISNA